MASISSAAQDNLRRSSVIDTLGEGYYGQSGKVRPGEGVLIKAVKDLLLHIGEDPEREGLKDTPARVIKALTEMTEGYTQDPAKILSRVFAAEDYDEIVIVKGVSFTSLCEHHLLAFSGTVNLGYLPSEKGIVGLSKLARLVDCYSRRLQVQERMTRQIAEAIRQHLSARGVGVIVKAHHSCMGCRGVKKPEAQMVTSVMLGMFREDVSTRQEFLTLCNH